MKENQEEDSVGKNRDKKKVKKSWRNLSISEALDIERRMREEGKLDCEEPRISDPPLDQEGMIARTDWEAYYSQW